MSARPDDAAADADAADAASAVHTRGATGADVVEIVELFESVWGVGRSPDTALLRAIVYAGNSVLVATVDEALIGPPRLIGATFGVLGWEDGVHIHSHMTAVVDSWRGHGAGLALKLRQRAIALAHGVTEIRWTFDPLIRRNAVFNVRRLGAEVAAYLPDFYGRLDDRISGSDRSDRVEARWRLESARAARALERGGVPEWSTDRRLALHPDYEALRSVDPDQAASIRDEARSVFAEAVTRGLRPELDANGDWVFTEDDAQTGAPAPADQR